MEKVQIRWHQPVGGGRAAGVGDDMPVSSGAVAFTEPVPTRLSLRCRTSTRSCHNAQLSQLIHYVSVTRGQSMQRIGRAYRSDFFNLCARKHAFTASDSRTSVLMSTHTARWWTIMTHIPQQSIDCEAYRDAANRSREQFLCCSMGSTKRLFRSSSCRREPSKKRFDNESPTRHRHGSVRRASADRYDATRCRV